MDTATSFYQMLKPYVAVSKFYCVSCGWKGTEDALDHITKIDVAMVCCPLCKSDDIGVVNDE